jgi:arylsulfatase A-like enzyme
MQGYTERDASGRLLVRRYNLIVSALIALLPLAGCDRDPDKLPPPNILLISIDALRADHLSCYGYGRHTSPFLDSLAARGTRFSHAFVNTHGTPPSHVTMLSSLYQESHRVGIPSAEASDSDMAIATDIELLQEILAREGWTTVAVTGGGFLKEVDFFSGHRRNVEQGAASLADLVDRALETGQPVFAFFHSYQVHTPYRPPSSYDGLFGDYASEVEVTGKALAQIQADAAKQLRPSDFDYLEVLYDRELRYTDDTLRELFRLLDELDFLDRSIVLITSDHGEEFGDHGGLLHRGTLYDELLRVPLIVHGTGLPSAVVEAALASTIDIAPTVLAAVGIDPPPIMEGRDLFAPHESERALQRVFSQYGTQIYSVRTPRWKLISYPGRDHLLLFDLDNDPNEKSNMTAQNPERADRLRAELEQWRAARPRFEHASRPSIEVTEETREQLEALGYVE